MVLHTQDPVPVNDQALHQCLFEIQVGLLFHNCLHGRVVANFVVLGPCGLHCRPLFGVQGLVLDCRLIGNFGHLSAQCIDLLDQLSLGHSTDGWAARHGGDLVQVDGQQQNTTAHAGRRQGALAAGVPPAHNDHIVLFLIYCHIFSLPENYLSHTHCQRPYENGRFWFPAMRDLRHAKAAARLKLTA